MLKKIFLHSMVAMFLMFGFLVNAHATDFQGTVTAVSNQNSTSFIRLTQADTSYCYLVVPSAVQNTYLAIILTASSVGKSVVVTSDQATCAGGNWGTMSTFNMIN